MVEVLDGEERLLTLKADQYRPDLEAAGIGDGCHSFSLPGIGNLLQRPFHLLSVRRADDHRELECSPAWIAGRWTEAGPFTGDLIGQIAAAAIGSASRAEEIGNSLDALLAATKRLAAAQAALKHSPDSSPSGRTDGQAGDVAGLLAQYPRLELTLTEPPVVSVIIAVHNHWNVTYDCLKSIATNPPQTSFELIIIDDASSDDTVFASLFLPEHVRIERMDANRGFIACCNRGAAQARGDYLFFLNNDTLVQPGWLDELVGTFERSAAIGVVGSRLLSVDGRVQDAGGVVWQLGDAWNAGRDADAEDPRFRYLREADYVTGAALMIRTALFRALGGFDPLFAPAYYEDTDLAFRVRAEGYRVLVQPASQIVHLEGVSCGRGPEAIGIKRFQAINQAKFHQRWRGVLAQHRLSGQEPEREAERGVARRAYFIDDSVPTPDQDAGSNAALQHMLVLQALGYKVTFIPADNLARIDPYTQQLERLGIECIHAPYYRSAEQFFRADRIPPELIYLHRYSNALKYAGMARLYFPRCKLLCSVADLHFLRVSRQAAVEGSREREREAQDIRRRELQALHLVDSVVVHSIFEATMLRRLAPSLHIEVVGWTVPARAMPAPITRNTGIAFIAGFDHPPNRDAAAYLLADIMPLIRRRDVAIRCMIAGSKIPDETFAHTGDDIDVLGFVPDLATVFNQVRCSIAPLRYGAGIKGKVLDSFSHGVPCVMSEVAAEGLNLPAELLWLIARSPLEFAEKIAMLHLDDARAGRLARACSQFVVDNFSGDVVLRQLRCAIEPKRQSAAPVVIGAPPAAWSRIGLQRVTARLLPLREPPPTAAAPSQTAL
jgi:GT2 family glycosyltransferase